ncbi:MAG: hypothetical protein M1816_002382 [Peltula sp. TS41687]|nr:MAG: hypothetical protein M1816_002382 [Peltula sp. TS41687]
MSSSELPAAGRGEKRRARDDLPSSSPDAPVFSSDGLQEDGVEEQPHPRRPKRQYRGRWWEPGSTIESGQVESATMRASDATEGAAVGDQVASQPNDDIVDDGVVVVDEAAQQQDLIEEWAHRQEALEEERLVSEEIEDPPSRNWYDRNNAGDEPNDPLFLARAIVWYCLENGKEEVDLSGLGLEYLPDDLVLQMADMVRPLNPGAYASLVPALKLFLSWNELRVVPRELFSLENLTVLSLRNNSLEEIPSAIGKLSQLCELNLSANKLRTLPFTILELITNGNLKVFIAHPNPFVEPPQIAGDPEPQSTEAALLLDAEGTAWATRAEADRKYLGWGPTRCAISPVRYFDTNGTAISTTRPPIEVPTEQEGTPTRLPPSLIELVLRACYRHPRPAEFIASLRDQAPQHLGRALEEVQKAREEGGRVCSVCGDHYILPRTEFIEFWYCTQPTNDAHVLNIQEVLSDIVLDAKPIPLLRKGCSWTCAPSDSHPPRLWLKRDNNVSGVLEMRNEL